MLRFDIVKMKRFYLDSCQMLYFIVNIHSSTGIIFLVKSGLAWKSIQNRPEFIKTEVLFHLPSLCLLAFGENRIFPFLLKGQNKLSSMSVWPSRKRNQPCSLLNVFTSISSSAWAGESLLSCPGDGRQLSSMDKRLKRTWNIIYNYVTRALSLWLPIGSCISITYVVVLSIPSFLLTPGLSS